MSVGDAVSRVDSLEALILPQQPAAPAATAANAAAGFGAVLAQAQRQAPATKKVPQDLQALIAAAAVRHGFRIFTTDTDFDLYADHLPIKRHHYHGQK